MQEDSYSQASALLNAESGDDIDFLIYPNPVSETLNIYLEGRNSLDGELELIDISGKVVKESIVNENYSTYIWDISSLSSGDYFVRCKNDYVSLSKKVTIVN